MSFFRKSQKKFYYNKIKPKCFQYWAWRTYMIPRVKNLWLTFIVNLCRQFLRDFQNRPQTKMDHIFRGLEYLLQVLFDERYLRLVAYIFTKLSLIMYLINTYILLCQHTRYDCILWNAFDYNTFFENFSHSWQINHINHKIDFCPWIGLANTSSQGVIPDS